MLRFSFVLWHHHDNSRLAGGPYSLLMCVAAARSRPRGRLLAADLLRVPRPGHLAWPDRCSTVSLLASQLSVVVWLEELGSRSVGVSVSVAPSSHSVSTFRCRWLLAIVASIQGPLRRSVSRVAVVRSQHYALFGLDLQHCCIAACLRGGLTAECSKRKAVKYDKNKPHKFRFILMHKVRY